MIPSKLREKVGMETGKEYPFYLYEENGKQFICIECGPNKALEEAIKLLEENGMKVT